MGSGDRRIVLLGRTGVGKSSAGNTIFGGEAVFHTKCSPLSTTHTCESETRTVGGREITLIDPPGFFDTEIPDEDALRREMLRCITECAPGPHAFLIVLKVGKFTKQEKEVVEKIEQYFSPETFKYAAVLFTHGYQLKGKTVEEFVELNAELSALVRKCGGRCHVLDNKYWKKKNEEEEEEEEDGRYASNTLQVARILQTIDKMAEEKMAEEKMAEEEKNGGCYTNEMLRAVHEGTQEEMEEIRRESGGEDMPEKEVKKKAKKRVHRKLIKCVGIATGALLGALLGVAVVAEVSVTVLFKKAMAEPVAAGGGVAAAAAGVAAAAATGGGALAVAAGVAVAAAALLGAAEGGWVGAEAAEGAETVGQAAKRAGKATRERAAAKRTAMLNKALEGMKIEKASSSSSSSSSSSKDEKQKADSKKE